MSAFETPTFLQNHSPKEVHALMKGVLPTDIDMSQGGHAYNLTYATALVVGEVCEFILPRVIDLIFPETSYGSFVDNHAKGRNLTRRAATPATSTLTITGEPKTVIPEGSLFSTAEVNDKPSVDYATAEAVTIPDAGSVSVAVECTTTGTIGNTMANTVVLVSSRLKGITSVTNVEPLTGGTERETDASFIERIVEYDKSQGESYIGSVADYKRWAMRVPGVGSATVIPAQDTSGLVTIIILGSNGDPATQDLCNDVYNHIMRPDAPGERLAPINATIKVEAPATMNLCIKATVVLGENATLESVKAAYADKLALYLPVALDEGEIKYSRVAAALAATEGADDYTDVQIGVRVGETVTYGTSNIAIATAQLPAIDAEDLVLTSAVV